MGRVSFGQYGNYTTPQSYTLSGHGSLPGIILGQWWYDFSRISEANIDIFMGIEHRFASGGGASNDIRATYGLFIQPDGDIPAGDLFFSIPPDVQKIALPQSTAFHGFDASATIANPGAPMQILFAVVASVFGSPGTNPTTFEWRSLLADFKGV